MSKISKLYTVHEAGHRLGRSGGTVTKAVREAKIPHTRVGGKIGLDEEGVAKLAEEFARRDRARVPALPPEAEKDAASVYEEPEKVPAWRRRVLALQGVERIPGENGKELASLREVGEAQLRVLERICEAVTSLLKQWEGPVLKPAPTPVTASTPKPVVEPPKATDLYKMLPVNPPASPGSAKP